MSAEADDGAWRRLVKRLSAALGVERLSPEQAEAEYSSAPEAHLSEDNISCMAKSIASGKRRRIREQVSPSLLDSTSEIADDMLVLNRNLGEEDPEVTRRLEDLRKQARDEDVEDLDDDPRPKSE